MSPGFTHWPGAGPRCWAGSVSHGARPSCPLLPIPLWLRSLLVDLRCRCWPGLLWHLVCGQLVALQSHRRGGSPLRCDALTPGWGQEGVPTERFRTVEHHVRTRWAWSSPGSAFLLGMEPLLLLLLV